jgi:hypothetical protein
MSTLSRVLLSLCFPLLLLPGQLWALAFEATGTAPWDARQPTLSRERALQQAVRQIRQKASDYMRLRRQNEQTRGGLGGYDALEAYQAGAVDNVRVVEEQIKGGQLLLTVIGDIELYRDCQGGRADPPHRLTLALTHFPLQRPEQANTGYLHDIQNRFSNFLAYELRRSSALFNAIDLDRVNLVDDPTQAPARLLPEGRVTTALQQAEQFNVQYLISGVFRSMALIFTIAPASVGRIPTATSSSTFSSTMPSPVCWWRKNATRCRASGSWTPTSVPDLIHRRFGSRSTAKKCAR